MTHFKGILNKMKWRVNELNKVINVYHAIYNNSQSKPVFSISVKDDFSSEDISKEINNYFRKHLFASFPHRAELTSISVKELKKQEFPYNKKLYERNRELSFWNEFTIILHDRNNTHIQHQDLKGWIYHSYNNEYLISMFWKLKKEYMLEMKQRKLGNDALNEVIEYVKSRYIMLKNEM